MNALPTKIFVLSSLSLLIMTCCCQGQFAAAYTFDGTSAGDAFGQSVSSAGDVNGDGFDDVVVGARGDDSNGSNSGSVEVFSGVNGSVLYTFNGDSANDLFGYAVSGAGDVNGDGFDDVIVGAFGDDNNGNSSGSARVFSGVDGSVLYTFNGDSANDWFGWSVSGAGDVNGDGFSDVIVGAKFDDNNGDNSGSARVFSGVDGSVLYTFNGDFASEFLGHSVSGAGDVNGDGFDDLVVGAPGGSSGSARLFSGLNGASYTINGDSAGDQFGYSVSGAGDVNGDGFDDVIVGALRDDNNVINSGSARVVSGLDGSQLFIFDGDSTNDWFGYSVSGVGDVNNDGFDDVIVGARFDDNNGSDSGSARVFSGIDGSTLYTFDGDSPNDSFGISVSGAGDTNGDGFSDIIVGAFGDDNNGSNSGSARVFLADSLPVYSFSTNTSSPHFLQQTWQPDGGMPAALTGSIFCTGATPGGSGLVGVSLASQDTVYFGFLPVLVDGSAANLISTTNVTFGSQGEILAMGISRQSPLLAGLHVYVQFFEIAPLVLSSNGLRFLMAP